MRISLVIDVNGRSLYHLPKIGKRCDVNIYYQCMCSSDLFFQYKDNFGSNLNKCH
jgi:hypothetical protein